MEWKIVVVIDDSQLYSEEFLMELSDLASDKLKVIVATTDSLWETAENVRISATASVQTMNTKFRERRVEILGIVQKFDSHIGDGFCQGRLENLLDLAAEAHTPWEFCYYLRRGWSNTKEMLQSTRDFDGANILLFAIASRQLFTLDAGVTREELLRDVTVVGRGKTWLRESLDFLAKKKLIIQGDTIRCLHLQSAGKIAEVSLNSVVHNLKERAELIELARLNIGNSQTTLKGVSWFLHRVREANRGILTEDLKSKLVDRCFHAHSPIERRDSCYVLDYLLGWRHLDTDQFYEQHGKKLRTWILETTHSRQLNANFLISSDLKQKRALF